MASHFPSASVHTELASSRVSAQCLPPNGTSLIVAILFPLPYIVHGGRLDLPTRPCSSTSPTVPPGHLLRAFRPISTCAGIRAIWIYWQENHKAVVRRLNLVRVWPPSFMQLWPSFSLPPSVPCSVLSTSIHNNLPFYKKHCGFSSACRLLQGKRFG